MKPISRASCLKPQVVLILLFSSLYMYSQTPKTENHPIRLGLNIGTGTQENFLFESANYNYECKFYKFQINYRLNNNKRKVELALNIEPSIYQSDYFPYYETEFNRDNSQEKSVIPKDIREFALNVGLQAKFGIVKSMSAYILGSIGPTFSNTETDRLNSGMSFSDIIALGFNYDTSFSLMDFRLSFRHVSNAGLNNPNKGYNSLNFEVGFTLPLKI